MANAKDYDEVLARIAETAKPTATFWLVNVGTREPLGKLFLTAEETVELDKALANHARLWPSFDNFRLVRDSDIAVRPE